MNIVDRYGLTVAEISTDEALHGGGDWGGLDIDLLRVCRPRPQDQALLVEAGFVVKPSWVNWVAPLRDSEADYLGALTKKQQRNVRWGLDFVASAGLRTRFHHPLEEKPLEEFLRIYEEQVATMRNGLNLARGEQRSFLDEADSHLGVFAYDGSRMVGGCVGWLRPDASLFQLRYMAAAPDSRRGALTRALYMAAFRAGRELGCTRMSLGNDPSLYGHVTAPGLYQFKKRLGFTPLPSQTVDPGVGTDEADRFVSLRALTHPSLLLAYDEDYARWDGTETDRPQGLKLHVLATRDDVDTSLYQAGFLASLEMTVVCAARRADTVCS